MLTSATHSGCRMEGLYIEDAVVVKYPAAERTAA